MEVESKCPYKHGLENIHNCTCMAEKSKEEIDRALMLTGHKGHRNRTFISQWGHEC